MKKITPIAALALIALAFTSCKKDYTCTCTQTNGGQVVGTPVSFQTGKLSKAAAEDKCNEGDVEGDNNGVVAKIDCEL